MSFLRKLFGGGAPATEKSAAPRTLEYRNHLIEATPFKEKDRYHVCGTISLIGDGAAESENFIRADSFPTFDDAVEMTFFKARQIIDLRSGREPI